MANTFYLGTFILYLLIVLGIGVWGYKQTDTIDDFWVYGRELGPWLATWSFVANFVSAVAVIGVIGAIYDIGYAIMGGIIFGVLLGISVLYFVVHRIRELGQVTLSDIIADITGKQWSRPIAGVILLGNDWLYTVMQLVGATFLITTITGVPYKYMVWVIGFVFITYTVLGGLVSVAWTDLLQGTLMVATVFLAFFYMLFDLGGLTSINQQFAALDAAHVAPLGDGVYTPIGLVGAIITFFGTIFTGQNYIIRINATRDVETAKFHLAASGAILSVFYFALVWLGGATTVALHSAGLTVEQVDKAFPVFITDYLPTSVGMIVILAVMSAILSTTDTRLHATGVTATRDIYDYFADDPTDERKLKVSRLSTIVLGVAATAVAVDPPGTIISLYTFRAILLTSAFLIPVYTALYWRGIDGRAVLSSMVLGTVSGVGWRITGGFFNLQATIVGVSVAFFTLVALHVLLDGDETASQHAVD